MLLASSERGVTYSSTMRTVVLPQRLVGETSTMNGVMSPASIVHACKTHSAKASPAPGGSTIYLVNSALIASNNSAVSTSLIHGSTFQCGSAASSSSD